MENNEPARGGEERREGWPGAGKCTMDVGVARPAATLHSRDLPSHSSRVPLGYPKRVLSKSSGRSQAFADMD